jgi:hypothetical protein
MTPERWQRVKTLFHAAQERPADERAGFLAEACVTMPKHALTWSSSWTPTRPPGAFSRPPPRPSPLSDPT